MRTLRRVLVLSLVVAVAVLFYLFATQNGAPVDVAIPFRGEPLNVALWLALLAASGVGALAAALVLLFELARVGLTARQYRRAVASLESEIHQLRNLPLVGGGVAEVGSGGSGPGGGERDRRV
jgi:uncharacterized integral membrane protein